MRLIFCDQTKFKYVDFFVRAAHITQNVANSQHSLFIFNSNWKGHWDQTRKISKSTKGIF